MSPSKPASNSFPSADRFEIIDVFRGLAAFMVVIYHARIILCLGGAEGLVLLRHEHDLTGLLWLLLVPICGIGAFGVDLFFVLSGYCIHSGSARLLQAGDKSPDWRRFFIRRLLRIYPAYFVALLLSAAACYWLKDQTSDQHLQAGFSLQAFMGNLLNVQGLLVPVPPCNGAFWTLSIEMHLYLFYPVVLCVARKCGPSWMVLLALGVSVATIATLQITNVRDWFPWWHAGGPLFSKYLFTWVVGAFVAEIHACRVSRSWWFSKWIGFAALGLTVVLRLAGYDEWSVPCIGFFFGIMLLEFTQQAAPVDHRSRLITMLSGMGVFSFSLYLIHMPVLYMIRHLGFSKSVFVFVTSVVLIMVLAFFLFRFVERPFMHRRDLKQVVKE